MTMVPELVIFYAISLLLSTAVLFVVHVTHPVYVVLEDLGSGGAEEPAPPMVLPKVA
jgi:hypothetical protein